MIQKLPSKMAAVLLFYFFISALSAVSLVESNNMERKLFRDILSNYHNHLRPASNVSQATNIDISIRLIRIFELSAKQQVLITSAWIEQSWQDPALRWNQTDYEGIDELTMMNENIWVPDVVLLNNADSTTIGRPVNHGNALLLSSNGVVRWLAPVLLRSTCKLNVRYFPFDEQLCALEFTTWTSGQSEVQLRPSTDDMFLNYSESSEWSLRGAHITNTTPALSPDSTDTRSGVMYRIHIERQVFYYFFYLISPCMLVSLINLVLFILPPDCGELMVVGVTLLLSLTVFFLLASTHIPETSEVVPLIGRYYSLTIIQVSCSLGLICWVLRLHHHNISSGAVPTWIRIYVLGYVAKVLRYPVPENVVAASYAKENNRSGDRTNDNVETTLEAGDETGKPDSNKCHPRQTRGLDMMAKQVKKRQENDKKQEEWQLVAMVINRLFLVIYVITVLLTLVGIFLQIPQLLGNSSIHDELESTV